MMPFKNESQSYKGFKIPNCSPFLSEAANTGVAEDCVDPARCSKLLWTIDSFTDWHTSGHGMGRWVPWFTGLPLRLSWPVRVWSLSL